MKSENEDRSTQLSHHLSVGEGELFRPILSTDIVTERVRNYGQPRISSRSIAIVVNPTVLVTVVISTGEGQQRPAHLSHPRQWGAIREAVHTAIWLLRWGAMIYATARQPQKTPDAPVDPATNPPIVDSRPIW